jgi:hypothetical protein
MLERSVQNSVIDFIEAYHTAMGEFPGRGQIVQAIQTAVGDAKESPTGDKYVDSATLDAFLESEEFIKSLDERGIVAPWVMITNPIGLTREQLAVAASLNNIKDRRSDSKKLADLGISSRKYAGWCHNKSFTNYMKISANNLLENMEAEAHMGLLRSLGNNNTQAQKLYFEMTGRYNPAYENETNLQLLMTRVIEIIQKHVHDPDALSSIAADLQLAAVETGAIPGSKNQAAIQNNHAAIAPPVEDKFSQPERGLSF